ncbi:chromo domain-containing protein [Rutstroemia sp. NJR-2017a BBW]|nr:chromo domain-containing protein [Rutstroemia sp. NJR-2017a BBW]
MRLRFTEIIEDESSAGDVSEEEFEVKKVAKGKGKGKGKAKQEEEPAEELKVESEEEEEDEAAADEYVVEKIVNHALDEQEFLMEKLQGKRDEIAEKKQGKKRGRRSTGASTPQNSGKKSRRNGTHPASQTPPLAAKEAQFAPPSGSWEDKVVDIEAMAGTDNEVIVYLTWEGGHKSQHPLHQVYKRCPQRGLQEAG